MSAETFCDPRGLHPLSAASPPFPPPFFSFYPQASESPHKGSISILRVPIGQFPTPLFISLFPLQSKLVRKMAAHESGDLERRAIGPPLGSGEGILKQKDARSSKAGHQLVRHLERFKRVM